MSDVLIKVKLLNLRAKLPTYMTPGSAGLDIYSTNVSRIIINPNHRVLITTGLSFEIPEGYEVQLRSRSGLAMKWGIIVLNSPATIDSDYRGEIKVILANTGTAPFILNYNERIAQMVVQKVNKVIFEEVQTFTDTIRGDRGFGHTGTQ